MPAANNLQDGNLADKQGPTGKRLSTCSHRTMSNPATCVPCLQRKRHCDHLISDLPAAAPEKLVQKKKKKQMRTSILSNFIPWSSFWGDRNSEKICSRLKRTLVTSVRNQPKHHPLPTPPVLLRQKSFFFLHSFVKKVGRAKVDIYNWILDYPNPHYAPVHPKGWQYPLPRTDEYCACTAPPEEKDLSLPTDSFLKSFVPINFYNLESLSQMKPSHAFQEQHQFFILLFVCQ